MSCWLIAVPAAMFGLPGPRRGLPRGAIAGLVNAVVSVPDGLATAALAGVNPVYGLYPSIAAPITGSLLASAQLMQISTTGARRPRG